MLQSNPQHLATTEADEGALVQAVRDSLQTCSGELGAGQALTSLTGALILFHNAQWTHRQLCWAHHTTDSLFLSRAHAQSSTTARTHTLRCCDTTEAYIPWCVATDSTRQRMIRTHTQHTLNQDLPLLGSTQVSQALAALPSIQLRRVHVQALHLAGEGDCGVSRGRRCALLCWLPGNALRCLAKPVACACIDYLTCWLLLLCRHFTKLRAFGTAGRPDPFGNTC